MKTNLRNSFVLVSFPLPSASAWEKLLRGEKVYCVPLFQRFWSTVGWFHCCGPEVRQKCGGRAWWRTFAYLMAARSGERVKEPSGKGLGIRYTLQNYTPCPLLLLTGVCLLFPSPANNAISPVDWAIDRTPVIQLPSKSPTWRHMRHLQGTLDFNSNTNTGSRLFCS